MYMCIQTGRVTHAAYSAELLSSKAAKAASDILFNCGRARERCQRIGCAEAGGRINVYDLLSELRVAVNQFTVNRARRWCHVSGHAREVENPRDTG